MICSVCMMLKNESKSIMTTLKTIPKFIKILIVLDTGSTDNTIEIIEDFCKDNDKKLYLKRSTFIDFSSSRNELVEFINSLNNCEYTLVLDAKDEIILKKNEKFFEKFFEKNFNQEVFSIRRQFKMNDHINEFSNILCLKIPTKWRYKEPIHNIIYKPGEENSNITIYTIPGIIVYQLREFKDIMKRHYSTLKVLKDQLKINQEKKDDRNVLRYLYYLGETYLTVKEYNEAGRYFKEYIEKCTAMNKLTDIEREQKFSAYIKLIKSGLKIKLNFYYTILPLIHLAMQENPERAEPFVFLASWYLDIKKYVLAKFFIDKACSFKLPNLGHIPYDSFLYNFRWELKNKIYLFFLNEE